MRSTILAAIATVTVFSAPATMPNNCNDCRKEGKAWCNIENKASSVTKKKSFCTEDKVGACPTRRSHVGKASGLPDCNNRNLRRRTRTRKRSRRSKPTGPAPRYKAKDCKDCRSQKHAWCYANENRS
jgi:hypothetical protein